jgi:serine/threonine-protein kinase Stk1
VLLHREFVLTAHLHHPHVVRVLHFDIDPRRRCAFLTLELMRGLNLAQLQRERPDGLPWHELREIAMQLLDALAYAHGRGVLHGDLKPGNVMLTEQGLRLFDFGVGQPAEGVLEGLPALRRRRIDAWTPAYAAPELMEGGSLTRAADVYAAACVIYELACGTHPYLRLEAVRARAERLDRALRMPRSLPSACRSMLHRALALDAHERQVEAAQLYRTFAQTPRDWGRWLC